MKTAPLPTYPAKVYKEKVGVKELIESGWNLSEAETEFGADWPGLFQMLISSFF